MAAKSKCSAGTAITFYWRECTTGNHRKSAVDKLLAACATTPYEWGSTYVEENARAAFDRRIRKLERGMLTPPSELKPLAKSRRHPLFEVRWSDIRLTYRDPVSGLTHLTGLEARLYFYDPASEAWVLGVRAHRKDLSGTPEEIRARQDAQIDCAINYLVSCEDSWWGVPELSQQITK